MRPGQPPPRHEIVVGRAQDALIGACHERVTPPPIRAGRHRSNRRDRRVRIAIPAATIGQGDEEPLIGGGIDVIAGQCQAVHGAGDVRRHGFDGIAAIGGDKPRDAIAGRQQQRAIGGLEHVDDGPDRELLENVPRRTTIGRATQTAVHRDGEEHPIGLEVAREGRGRERCDGRTAPGVAAIGREEKTRRSTESPTASHRGRSRAIGGRERCRQPQDRCRAPAILRAVVPRSRRGLPLRRRPVSVAAYAVASASKPGEIARSMTASWLQGGVGENRLPGGAAIGSPHDAVAAGPAHPTGLPPAGERQAIICEVGRKRQGSRHAAVGACRTPVSAACRLCLRCGCGRSADPAGRRW